ncbi:hypothetical protein LINGRAHAP2_LOCUS5190, partial [Linum grandiflorum]
QSLPPLPLPKIHIHRLQIRAFLLQLQHFLFRFHLLRQPQAPPPLLRHSQERPPRRRLVRHRPPARLPHHRQGQRWPRLEIGSGGAARLIGSSGRGGHHVERGRPPRQRICDCGGTYGPDWVWVGAGGEGGAQGDVCVL